MAVTIRRTRKRRRPPYAARSVWIALAIIAAVFIVGGAVLGYQVHQLQSDVNALNNQLTSMNHIAKSLK